MTDFTVVPKAQSVAERELIDAAMRWLEVQGRQHDAFGHSLAYDDLLSAAKKYKETQGV